jgi:UDP:flavonoid glycosyltransferase YjiC (YdhE family)
VAALCFGAAVLRLRHGAAEPPAGRVSPDRLSLTQLRAGLRHEYAVVRGALVVVVLCAAVDLARTAASIIAAQSGDPVVGTSVAWTAIEAAGYVVAALVLALWASAFGAEVRRLGAL